MRRDNATLPLAEPEAPSKDQSKITRSGPRDTGEAQKQELSIGDLADLTSVSSRTIRYYEELGILPPAERTSGGTRRYSRSYLRYVEGAKILKQFGFVLEEIAELGQVSVTDSKRAQAILDEKLAELDHRATVLSRLRQLLLETPTSDGRPRSPGPELLLWVSDETTP